MNRGPTGHHYVTDPAEQRMVFHVRIPAPYGLETLTVEVNGYQDPRAVVWALEILGEQTNLDQTWQDLVNPTPCPVHAAEQIIAQAFEDSFQDPPL